MADIQKTVEIVFGGKNELSKTIEQIERDFGQIDMMVGKVTAPLAAVGDNILKLDAALAALAIGGIALSIKKADEFGTAFAEITTLIDDTGAGVGKFKDQILEYSSSSTKSIADINKSIYAAISAGVEYTDAVAFMGVTEKLSVAGKADLESTTKALVSTLNAYGESTDQAGRYSDVLFQVVRKGQTTLPELSGSLAQVTSIAAAGGVPIETLGAAIATLTAKGMPTTQAMSSLKNVINAMLKPTGEAKAMAQSLGIEFSAQALKAKGLDGVLADVMRTTKGNTAQTAQLFGAVEGLAGVLALGGEDALRFKGDLEAMAQATDVVNVAFAKMKFNLDLAVQNMKNNADLLFISVGSRLEAGAGQLVSTFADLFKGIKVGVDSGAFDPLFAYLNQLGGELSTFIGGIAKALPEAFKLINFDTLLDALNNLRRAFGSYMDDLDMTKPKDLAAVIQFLIDAVSGLINVTAGMVQEFRPFLGQVAEFLITMSQADEETQRSTGSLLALSMVIEKVGFGFAIALKFAQEYGVGIGNVFDIVTGGAQVMFNGLQILMTAVKGLILIIEGTIVDMLDKLTFGMFPGLEALKNDITKQGEEIGKAFEVDFADSERGLEKFLAGFGKIGEEIGKGTDAAGKLRDRVGEIGESAANATPPVDSLADELEMLGEKVVTPKVAVAVDEKQLDTVVQSVAKAIPAKKEVKVEPTADEKKLKEQSAIIQKAMDVKAKVDIAEIEAAAKTTQAVFTSLDSRIKGTSDVYDSLVKGLSDPSLTYGLKSELESLLSKEAEHRANAMKQSEELTQQQIELNKLKLEALARGDNEITVRADGLKPHLEMIMWEVLEAIQIRASATQAEFLLGYK